jgi:beta-phosphoglucomutase
MASHDASEPAAVLTALRLQLYGAIVSAPQVLRDNQWPHNVALLRTVRTDGYATAVATMSTRKEAQHVLETLEVMNLTDILLGREDARNPKPDPEMYLLAAIRLNVPSGECLVVEDSPAGVQASLAAGMSVVAVATPFTECGLRGAPGIDPQWISATRKRCSPPSSAGSKP